VADPDHINAEHNHGQHELLRKQYSEVFIKSNSEYGDILKEQELELFEELLI